jgi:DNA-binding winged helix-turn-helix (wHTH) protein
MREANSAMNDPMPRECYELADLSIDVGAMRVWQRDVELRLPPLSFELLLLLVRRAPDVVTRDECLGTIWRGVVVGPETLKQRVKLLREALGDSSRRPVYVETVRGRGYRLVPPVLLKDDDPDDWPSRLRSRLKGLLGNGRQGNDRGPGTLALGGVLLMIMLSTGRTESPPVIADSASPALTVPEAPAPAKPLDCRTPTVPAGADETLDSRCD